MYDGIHKHIHTNTYFLIYMYVTSVFVNVVTYTCPLTSLTSPRISGCLMCTPLQIAILLMSSCAAVFSPRGLFLWAILEAGTARQRAFNLWISPGLSWDAR